MIFRNILLVCVATFATQIFAADSTGSYVNAITITPNVFTADACATLDSKVGFTRTPISQEYIIYTNKFPNSKFTCPASISQQSMLLLRMVFAYNPTTANDPILTEKIIPSGEVCTKKAPAFNGDYRLCYYESNNLIDMSAAFTVDAVKPSTPVISGNIRGANDTIIFTLGDTPPKSFKNVPSDGQAVKYHICLTKISTNLPALPSPEGGEEASDDTATPSNPDCQGGKFTILPSSKNDFARVFTPYKVSFDSLEVGATYNLKVRAVTSSGNTSDWLEVPEITTYPQFTPLQEFGAASCQQAKSSPSSILLWALLAIGLLWARPRRQAKLFIAAPFVVVFFCLSAFADLGDISIGFLGSPYAPAIDLSKTASGEVVKPIYRCFFDDKTLPLIGGEVNWHLFDGFGSFQAGFSAQYAWVHGKTREASINASDCGKEGVLDVGLHIIQITPQVTYILNPHVRYLPLAPYVRAGIVGATHVSTYDGGLDKKGKEAGQSPIGVVFGYDLAAGVMLFLDVFGPDSIGAARGAGIFEHAYLKAEVAYRPIDNFGKNGWNLSPRNAFGNDLPWIMTFGLVFDLP